MFTTIGLLLTLGCSDLSGTTFDITSPTENQVFSIGDILTIQAMLTSSSEEGLHGYKVYVRNKADQSVLFSADQHTHGATIAINESWIVTVSSAELEVEIISDNNHDGGFNSRKINVSVN